MNEKKAKLKLEDIKVESFVTTLSPKDTEKMMAGCPWTTLPTAQTAVPICQPTGCCTSVNCTGLIPCYED